MIFEALHEAWKRGELICVEGGFCRWHKRQDGQLTIRELLSMRPGAGSEMLEKLKAVPDITKIVAKCPADLESNQWYKTKGFTRTAVEKSKTGRAIHVWELKIA